MRIWTLKREWLPNDGEYNVEFYPCADKVTARSYMEFLVESIKMLDDFIRVDIEFFEGTYISILTGSGRYILSIYQETMINRPI